MQDAKTVGEAQEAMRKAAEEFCRARHELWIAKKGVAQAREEYGEDEEGLENGIELLRVSYEANELDREVDTVMDDVGSWLEE